MRGIGRAVDAFGPSRRRCACAGRSGDLEGGIVRRFGSALTLIVPARVLASADYIVVVTGMTSSGHGEALAEHAVRLRPKTQADKAAESLAATPFSLPGEVP